MLETRAVVISAADGYAVVESRQQSGCGHCSTAGGCGSGTLSKMFCSSQPRRFQVASSIKVIPGDVVEIGLADGALLKGTTLAYLLPLAGLLCGAALAAVFVHTPNSRDGWSVAGGGIGLTVGLLVSAILSRRSAGKLEPAILRLVDR